MHSEIYQDRGIKYALYPENASTNKNVSTLLAGNPHESHTNPQAKKI